MIVLGSKRLTARECLAVLGERIGNLVDRIDKFDVKQEQMFENMLKNQRSINDLSHTVKAHQEYIEAGKEEKKQKSLISLKWKLGLVGSLSVEGLAILYLILSQILPKLL